MKRQAIPVVHATIRVAQDGSISGKAPRELPPGEYQAPITVSKPKPKRRRLDLPLHEAHWDDSVSLRREDANRSDFQRFGSNIEIVEP